MLRTKLFKDVLFVLAAIALLLFALSVQSCSDASASGKLRPRTGLDSVVRVRIAFSGEVTYLKLNPEERRVLRFGDIVYMNTIVHSTEGNAATVKAIIDRQLP